MPERAGVLGSSSLLLPLQVAPNNGTRFTNRLPCSYILSMWVFMCFPTFPVEQGWNEGWESHCVVSAAEDISAHSWLSCGQGGRDAESAWTPWVHPMGGKDGLWWLMSWADNPNGIYDPPEILSQIPLRGPSMCSFEQLVSLTLSSKVGEGLVSKFSHVLFHDCVVFLWKRFYHLSVLP